MPVKLEILRERYEKDIKYDQRLVALNFVEEELGGDKATAVQWIQENSGGGSGSEYNDTGETEDGCVWGRATYCDELSSWAEIISAISRILRSQGIE